MSAGFTRRSFTESLVLTALAPAFGVRPDAMIAPYAPTLVNVAESAAPGALARALARAISPQYGARLSAGDLATVTRQIQSSLDRAAQVRKVELANGDEPDFIYSALPRPADSR
jgi:hypothetical protein